MKTSENFMLGDTVDSIINKTGIKKISFGKKCGCEERTKRLNDLGMKMQALWGVVRYTKPIASVNEQGAGIMASMAQGAMSAANGVVAAVLSEEE